MRSRMAVGSAALLVLIVVGMVWAAAAEKAPAQKAAAHEAAAMATAWSSDDLTWEALPGFEGLQVAKLWGDMKKGPYGALVKRGPNQDQPLHAHSSAFRMVVLSGEFHYTPEGGETKTLGPGSYLMVPAGVRHSSGTGPEGATVFQEGTGPWDSVPVAAKSAKKAE